MNVNPAASQTAQQPTLLQSPANQVERQAPAQRRPAPEAAAAAPPPKPTEQVKGTTETRGNRVNTFA